MSGQISVNSVVFGVEIFNISLQAQLTYFIVLFARLEIWKRCDTRDFYWQDVLTLLSDSDFYS